jgi:5-(carboxyamino)imidazole ribonucleotide mutase
MIGIVMGSKSDWPDMQAASETLDKLGIAHEVKICSAHRTPDLAFEYASTAEERGLEAIIAGAGCAAHLAGFMAAKTHLPVLGVPMQSKALQGLDSLLSTAQMPPGIPVATFSIGKHGAINAALFAAAILALKDEKVRQALLDFRKAQAEKVAAEPDPREG